MSRSHRLASTTRLVACRPHGGCAIRRRSSRCSRGASASRTCSYPRCRRWGAFPRFRTLPLALPAGRPGSRRARRCAQMDIGTPQDADRHAPLNDMGVGVAPGTMLLVIDVELKPPLAEEATQFSLVIVSRPLTDRRTTPAARRGAAPRGDAAVERISLERERQ
jgi:hypothetical protein